VTARAAALGVASLLALGTATPARGSADWFLLSRSGECAPAELLGRKDPSLRGVASPDALVARLRAQGATPRVTESDTGRGRLVQIEAPGRGLALAFVERPACRAFLER
jgi:hypothetical protein